MDFLSTWKGNKEYFDALQVLASLSGLFSNSTTPYLDYRLAENLFCKFFGASNEARSCTAYDARLQDLGIGIKTFILKKEQSIEKIAEFNKLKPELDQLSGLKLARKLGEFRNDRIQFADNTYGTTNRIYHIVGRTDHNLKIFNAAYEKINIDTIKVLRSKDGNLSFTDGLNEYTFNRSKSVLLKRFHVPQNDAINISVAMLADPLSSILKTFKNTIINPNARGLTMLMTNQISPLALKENLNKKPYIILPLYSCRKHKGIRFVPEKSGLNQWSARGRKRNENEVYIPIPKKIHDKFPTFFPPRNEHFILKLPNGESLSVKVCQDNGKALMSTHNADLGEWLLRKVLFKPVGELVTIDDLNRYGIDSVRIVNELEETSDGRKIYSILFASDIYESYEKFISI